MVVGDIELTLATISTTSSGAGGDLGATTEERAPVDHSLSNVTPA